MGDGADEVVVADVDVFVGGVIGVGSGDIGGDFKCSGFGMGVGFSAECETTMCLGLRGLSFLTIFCFFLAFESFKTLLRTYVTNVSKFCFRLQ